MLSVFLWIKNFYYESHLFYLSGSCLLMAMTTFANLVLPFFSQWHGDTKEENKNLMREIIYD